MAYFLVAEKNEKQNIPLDITKSKNYQNHSSNKSKECSLEDIDNFTMTFSSEEELKEHLLQERILDISLYDSPLSIINLSRNKYIKISHGLLYLPSIEYLTNPDKVIDKIEQFSMTDDFKFIKKLCNLFIENKTYADIAISIKKAAILSIEKQKRIKRLSELDNNNDDPIVRMAKMLIYDYVLDEQGNIRYKQTIKYRNLHIIIAFINSYEQILINKKSKTKRKNI